MTLALIDGDIIAHRASAAAQEDIDWGDGCEGLTVNVGAARSNARSMVKTWLDLSRCDNVLICLSPRDRANFRKVLTDYKNDRGSKPESYWAVVDALEEEWPVKVIPMLEADDVMGIMATSPKLKGAVIVSMDKDLQTIPGKLLNPLKDKRPRPIRPVDADRFWMFQTLAGDPVDGYKGCPGIGKVRAERLLADARNINEMWEVVRDTFIDRGLTEDDAILQARLARILRREDYDKEKDLIYLWHPNPRSRPTFSLASRA